MPNITKKELTAAFELWNADYRDDPDSYVDDETFRTDPETVSENQTETLLAYVKEFRAL